MRQIDLQELDQIRSTGYRPGVVICLLNNKRLFVVYRRDYSLWMLPQGGVGNKQSILEAVKNEMTKELGVGGDLEYIGDPIYIGEGDIKFNPKSKGIKDLHTDDGKKVDMIGKKYFFFGINIGDENISIQDSEFDEYCWANYEQAKFLLGKSYQVQKKELTLNALEQLKRVGLIDD